VIQHLKYYEVGGSGWGGSVSAQTAGILPFNTCCNVAITGNDEALQQALLNRYAGVFMMIMLAEGAVGIVPNKEWLAHI